METSEAAAAHPQKDSVKVAVNIRPLNTVELQSGSTGCISVTPGKSQVQIGPRVFTFDHVYGGSGLSSSLIFEQCVHPLINTLFSGYNATVLAYGQTGSGKTYTMGTDYSDEGNCAGIIPQVMDTIFRKVDNSKDGSEFLIKVSFVEIYKEDVFYLLDANHAAVRLDAGSMAKASAPGRVPIQIKETAAGGRTLPGVTEAEVKSKEEMASYLKHGSSLRATASTNMNRKSSRSHAIFTIFIEQKRTSGACDKSASSDNDILSSKLQLVDLAGSERAKHTVADGLRLKEGILINKGLLALSNVLSALGDKKKKKEGAFIPYRGSKLTRLLQDSLGGNSNTVMIACISPADKNKEETISTLKYASCARNIQNKAVVNHDPATAEIRKLKRQLEQQRCIGNAALEELQKKVSLLELKNSELNNELKERVTASTLLERDQKRNALESQVHKLKEKAKRLQKHIWYLEHEMPVKRNVFSRQLQQKIKEVSKQFRSWKAAREKEVLQLEKEERRNKYEMHKLLTLNQRQKMVLKRKTEKEGKRKEFEMHRLKIVLQRKTEEAATARKRLKEFLEAKKSSHETYGGSNGLRMQAMRAFDNELEVTVRAHKLCSYYEPQMLECRVLDKEVICNEKEHSISELKEKVVLNDGIRQSETQVKDLSSQNTQSCACSKSSQCKTIKCKCRNSGAQCGAGCGCKVSICSNRDSSSKEKANQGAMPLQNLFSEKEAKDARPRKPLTDIGNNVVAETSVGKEAQASMQEFGSTYCESICNDITKIQNPSFALEFYMYNQLDLRIPNIERPSFGYAREMHIFSDVSVLVCDYLPYGTLLGAINSYFGAGQYMDEVLCMYYTIEMLNMLETLHSVGIIHGDFKPDNILVCNPSGEITEDTFRSEKRDEKNQGLCLVDWGRGIDLNLFPSHTEFHGDWNLGIQMH